MTKEYSIAEFPIPVPLHVAVKFYVGRSIPPAVIARRLGVSNDRVRQIVHRMRNSGIPLPSFHGAARKSVGDAMWFKAAGLK